MAIIDPKKFILEQRKAGVSDEQIYDLLVTQSNEVREKVERGFFGEILPTAGQIVGGVVGSLGGPAGTIGGAAIGGAIGETAQQGIEIATGKRESLDPAQITATGFTGAVLEPVGMAGAGILSGAKKVVGKAIEPVAKVVRPKVVGWLSKLSGFTDEIVDKALSRAPGVKTALEKGEKALVEIVENSRSKLGQLKGLVSKEFGDRLSAISKRESLGGPGQEASRAVQLSEVQRFKLNAAKELRNNNIGVTQDGKLLFDRPSSPSRIVNPAEQKNIQEAFDLLRSIEKNTSVDHVEAVLERIRALKKFDTTSGAQTSKIVNDIFGQAEDVTRQLYPELAEIRGEYAAQRKLFEDADDLLGKKTLDAQEKRRITTKLYQLYNTGSLAQREAAEAIGETLGEDITGTAAGGIMKAGDTFSMRAVNLTKRGIGQQILNGIPRQVLENYAKTGKITGEIMDNAIIKKLQAVINFAAKAGSREAINLLEGKTIE